MDPTSTAAISTAGRADLHLLLGAHPWYKRASEPAPSVRDQAVARQAGPAVGTPEFAAERKRTLAWRAAQRRGGVQHKVLPGADYPVHQDAPGRYNPIAAGQRALHSGAAPSGPQFEGKLQFLNSVTPFLWQQFAPPTPGPLGSNPYSDNPMLHNIPEVYQRGARATDYALKNFQPYLAGISPELQPWYALAQQYAPQLMQHLGGFQGAGSPFGLML